jgi:hypothetical protein
MFMTPPPRIWRQIARPDLPAGRRAGQWRPPLAIRLTRWIGRPAPRCDGATLSATKPSAQSADR